MARGFSVARDASVYHKRISNAAPQENCSRLKASTWCGCEIDLGGNSTNTPSRYFLFEHGKALVDPPYRDTVSHSVLAIPDLLIFAALTLSNHNAAMGCHR